MRKSTKKKLHTHAYTQAWLCTLMYHAATTRTHRRTHSRSPCTTNPPRFLMKAFIMCIFEVLRESHRLMIPISTTLNFDTKDSHPKSLLLALINKVVPDFVTLWKRNNVHRKTIKVKTKQSKTVWFCWLSSGALDGYCLHMFMCVSVALGFQTFSLLSGNAPLTVEVKTCRPRLPMVQRSSVLRGIPGDTPDLQVWLGLTTTSNFSAQTLSKQCQTQKEHISGQSIYEFLKLNHIGSTF